MRGKKRKKKSQRVCERWWRKCGESEQCVRVAETLQQNPLQTALCICYSETGFKYDDDSQKQLRYCANKCITAKVLQIPAPSHKGKESASLLPEHSNIQQNTSAPDQCFAKQMQHDTATVLHVGLLYVIK